MGDTVFTVLGKHNMAQGSRRKEISHPNQHNSRRLNRGTGYEDIGRVYVESKS